MENQKRFLTPDIEPSAYILFAAAVLFVPLQWIVSWLVAAAVHELFHCCAVYLAGGSVQKISVGIRGAEIQADLRSDMGEGFCAIAGPIGGLALLLLARWAPRLALCALIQSAWNLIPIYPLDGGRALSAFLKCSVPKYADRLERVASVLVLFAFCAAGIYGLLFWKLGFLPIVLLFIILLRVAQIKIPCKRGRLRVQ
ncbi:MAG: hypothetical protein IJO45_02910 [Oscillospiraceae bacterium]|nr:hypothetical protein [Oscillospiraceae bacterium]